MAQEATGAEGPIHTMGPIIHNPGVVRKLAEVGISPVEDPDEVESGTIILRTHGVPPEVISDIEGRGINLVDATCPYVKVAQEKAALLCAKKYQPLILGEHDHPEVVALTAHAGKRAMVLENAGELAQALEKGLIKGKVGVVVQTTQAGENLAELIAMLAPATRELLVYNTMCNATRKCQDEALELAGRSEAVIIIGGRNSANTTRLAQLCRQEQVRAYHVEDVGELRPEWFAGLGTVAITAGASTPPEQMEAAAEWLRKLQP